MTDVGTYICYTQKHLSTRGLFNLAMQDVSLGDLDALSTSPSSGRLFQKTALTFVLIFFGTQHKHSDIAAWGYTMHGKALEQLNQDLSEPGSCTRDEVIISVVTLTLMECLAPTGAKHYLQHMLGLERLLELRGPGLYHSPHSLRIYKSIRHMILFASLRTGSPSILAKPEWKTFYRAECKDESEIIEQQLMEFLADCTVLMAERNALFADTHRDNPLQQQRCDNIKLRALACLSSLHLWRRRWSSDIRNTYLVTSAASFRQHPGPSWLYDLPSSLILFEFLDDSAAPALMFHSSVLIYILRVLISLTPECASDAMQRTFDHDWLQEPVSPDDLWTYTQDQFKAAEIVAAWEVMRCLLYFMARRPDYLASQRSLLQLALTTIWTIHDETLEGLWMTQFLRTECSALIPKGLLLVDKYDTGRVSVEHDSSATTPLRSIRY
ncbi:hypothetical protein B0A52_02451 [Exophiala mesophila]|uniref:Transcription factor domain-containing protein n=1 Tax=Exophiala mesophila TaxID=212818 RepID=A0A438NCQ3_EXOME|nr:hypothetical protein B0A52_02451 [Exophiala mesophila]